MRSVLFWDITQWIVVIPYRRFGTTYKSHLQDDLNLADGTCRLSQNVGKELHYKPCNIPEEQDIHYFLAEA